MFFRFAIVVTAVLAVLGRIQARLFKTNGTVTYEESFGECAKYGGGLLSITNPSERDAAINFVGRSATFWVTNPNGEYWQIANGKHRKVDKSNANLRFEAICNYNLMGLQPTHPFWGRFRQILTDSKVGDRLKEIIITAVQERFQKLS